MLIFVYKMGSSIFEGYSTVQRSDTNEILKNFVILDYKIKRNGKKNYLSVLPLYRSVWLLELNYF